ncbi:hypothetical protein OIO90_005948 [Microbotryomycetes sp. JL221]|nr:hypothetical protein OIO90_005948 [Microbotryomycetes sp. JL221]
MASEGYSRLAREPTTGATTAPGLVTVQSWRTTLQHYTNKSAKSTKIVLLGFACGLLLWIMVVFRSGLELPFNMVSSSSSNNNKQKNETLLLHDPYPDLPVFALHNGTRYHHPVPPSWPDPWHRSPNSMTTTYWLSATRFPPSRDTLGVNGNEPQVERARERIGSGLKPPRQQYQVPHDTLQKAFKVFAWSRRNWRKLRLHRGEGFNDTNGRPLQISSIDLFRGPSWWKMRELGKERNMPRIQIHDDVDMRTHEHKVQDSQRREWVRRAFLHAWQGYKNHAWGHDELRPLSGSADDKFSGWGATIFDSLNTLLIMGLTDEYKLAREHVARVDFSYLVPKDPTRYDTPSEQTLPIINDKQSNVRLNTMPNQLSSPPGVATFETVIRYLGSMISAYDLSGDPLMLERAIELGNWLLPSMSTRSGLLVPTYRFGLHPDGAVTGQVCIAEVGSVSLEFTRLSQITGDPIYFETISRAMDTLDNWKAQERVPHLFPTQINPDEPRFLPGVYSMGGQGDSYYEYLIKMHQLLGGASEQYARMYKEAMDSALSVLVHPINVVPGLQDAVTFADLHFREAHGGDLKTWLELRLDHLTAFAGGMLALGSKLLDRASDLVTAQQFTKACIWAYESTQSGLGAEILRLWSPLDPDRWTKVRMMDGTDAKTIKGDPMGVHSGEFRYIQRPETVETLLYMYRITGDRMYQDKGWTMFVNWIKATIVENGLANVDEINSERPKHEDSGVESFVFGETFKYYYLLFSPPDLVSFDDYVFTTEAHPFKLRSRGRQAPDASGPFWKDQDPLEMPSYELGQGTHVQNWARVVQAAAAVA